MSSSLMWSRPPVSQMTRSRLSDCAAFTPLAQIFGGSPPGSACTGRSWLRARVWSCSMAAGRRTSAATSIGRRPLERIRLASLAAVVVFPLPCSPTSMMMPGRLPPGGSE